MSNLEKLEKAYYTMLDIKKQNPAVWTLQFREALVPLMWLAKMVVDCKLCDECLETLNSLE